MSINAIPPQAIDVAADARLFFTRRYIEYKKKNSISTALCWLLLVQFICITVGSTTVGSLPISVSYLGSFALLATVIFVLSLQLLNLQAVKFYQTTSSELYKTFSIVVIVITFMFSILLGASTFLKIFSVEEKLNLEAREAVLTDVQQSALGAKVNVASAINAFLALAEYSEEQAETEAEYGGTCQVGVKGGPGPRTWFRNKFANDANVFAGSLVRTQTDLETVLKELAQIKDQREVLAVVGQFNGLVQAGVFRSVYVYSKEALTANMSGLYESPSQYGERFFSCSDEKLQRLLSNVIVALEMIQPLSIPTFNTISKTSAMQLMFDNYVLIARGKFSQVPTLVYISIAIQVFVDAVVIYLAKLLNLLKNANSVQNKLLNSRVFRRATAEQLINLQHFLISNRSVFGTYRANDVLGNKLFIQLKRLALAKWSLFGTKIRNSDLSMIIDIVDYHITMKEGDAQL